MSDKLSELKSRLSAIESEREKTLKDISDEETLLESERRGGLKAADDFLERLANISRSGKRNRHMMRGDVYRVSHMLGWKGRKDFDYIAVIDEMGRREHGDIPLVEQINWIEHIAYGATPWGVTESVARELLERYAQVLRAAIEETFASIPALALAVAESACSDLQNQIARMRDIKQESEASEYCGEVKT